MSAMTTSRTAPGSGSSARGTVFGETMLGTLRLDDEPRTRRVRLDLTVSADRIIRPLGTTEARATGRVRITGWADDPSAAGELEISPLARRRIRYRVTFTADGRRLTLDGWKSVTLRRPLTSMTVLPYTLYEDGARIGTGTLRFPLGTQLLPFLAGFRFPRREEPATFLTPRWRGEPGRADGFDRHLDEAERILRVATQPLDVLGSNGRIALTGARRLGWQAAPLRRNAPGCQGSCQCVVGCPTGAKQSVQLSVLPDACSAGARIVTEARVERIIVDTDRPGGPRAAGVRVRREEDGGFEILAPLVVVAAGALQSPPLLRRSGLGRHPRLGRNLSVHPATSVAGRFAAPVTAWEGVLQSVGVEQHHAEGILIEATATPPGMGSFILPGLGAELRHELDSADRLATLGAMIADRPSGRVLGRHRTLPHYQLHPRDAGRLMRAVRAMGRLLFAAGAEEVLTGVPRAPRVHSLTELEAVLARTRARELHLSAYHPTGTVAAGANPQHFPTDPLGRLRGVHGVLITDASVLPSCPQVNPQLTIMAASLAITEAHLGVSR
ncbi:GMC family oxidoreductase N-terminal domain-containing protein [Streptomyces sp. NPDC048521]|uniref:GMC family oxidoreductase N-terminal domain-containing protein n=1 Tax=Streptomyces sp. NPDC048521 TaxID=3365566 RepID=UPI0037164207